MPMPAGERVDTIRECGTLLDKLEWSDLDLTLRQFGVPTSDDDFEGRYAYCVNMVSLADDETLKALHHYLTGKAGAAAIGQTPWAGNRLRLFVSHLAEHRAAVGLVAATISRYGIECFVAHDSIEPSREWQSVIEAGLATCDAMVAFLHPGFIDSKWCDQEIGWAMGRRIPLLPLNYGAHPHGFMGKFQDFPCIGKYDTAVAMFVVDWLSKSPALAGPLAASLSYAFEFSGSWDHTRRLAPLLSSISTFSTDELQALERGGRNNVNVRECDIGGAAGPAWVADFVATRTKPSGDPAWPF